MFMSFPVPHRRYRTCDIAFSFRIPPAVLHIPPGRAFIFTYNPRENMAYFGGKSQDGVYQKIINQIPLKVAELELSRKTKAPPGTMCRIARV